MRHLLLIPLLAACSAPLPDPIRDAMNGDKPASPAAAMASMLVTSLVAGPAYANVRYIMPRGPGCQGAVRPRPILRAGINPETGAESVSGPVVGQEFRVIFWTSAMPRTLATPPWATANPIVGPEACWVVVGHDTSFVPRLIPQWPGCWQLIEPDATLPVGVAVGWQGSVKREPGSESRVDLRWTPGPEMLGARVQLQLLVYADGLTPHGFDLSQAVDLTVGTQ